MASEAKGLKSQVIENTTLTENQKTDYAICLAVCLQKFPELEQIIQAWPELPEHIKAAIKALIKAGNI